MSALYVLLRHISALIYPVRCPVCSKVIGAADGFCDKCESELVKYDGRFSIPKISRFTSAFEYNKYIAPAIFLMKDSVCGNAPYALGKAVAERIADDGIQADFIVPVPMYRENLRKRGYNQAELISREIGRITGMKVRTDIVSKNRKTLSQKELTKSQRKINLKGAFSVTDKSAVENKRILIVDDVCTTGSTVSEIAGILRKCGAGDVLCACVCKTPDLKR